MTHQGGESPPKADPFFLAPCCQGEVAAPPGLMQRNSETPCNPQTQGEIPGGHRPGLPQTADQVRDSDGNEADPARSHPAPEQHHKENQQTMAMLWGMLPAHIRMKIVVSHLPLADKRAWRLASKEWLAGIASSIHSLCPSPRPGLPQSGRHLAAKFPALTSLNLANVATDVSCGRSVQIHTGAGWHRRRYRDADSLPLAAVAASQRVENLLDGLEALPLLSLSTDGAIGLQDSSVARLSKLTSLTELSLGGAERWTGCSLKWLAPLTSLAGLSLAGCRKLHPEELSGITQLAGNIKRLDLERCPEIDDDAVRLLSQMTALESLSLRGCRVTDKGVGALRTLRSLKVLNLQGLPITSAALVDLSRLTLLQDLNLHGLSVGSRGSLSSLAHLTSLTRLNLRWCEDLADRHLQELSRIPSLHDLCLDRCRSLTPAGVATCETHSALTSLCLARCPAVDDEALERFSRLKNLAFLDLDGCQAEGFRGSSLHVVAALPRLQRLNMKGCKHIQELNLASLKAASSLRYLDLSWCQQLEGHGLMEGLGCLQLHGLSLAFCRNLCCLPLPMAGLQELNIAGCLSLDDPSNLCEITSLTSLDAEEIDTEGMDAWAHAISSLTSLTSLSLAECNSLTDDGLDALNEMPSLTFLSLRACTQVSDVGLARLWTGGHLTTLVTLSLEGLQSVTDRGLRELLRLQSLRYLSLAGCDNISGIAVKNFIDEAKGMTSLDLTGCLCLEEDEGLVALSCPALPLEIGMTP